MIFVQKWVKIYRYGQNAAELKAINKQINALQEEIGKLKRDISRYASLNRDATRDYYEMVLGDLE